MPHTDASRPFEGAHPCVGERPVLGRSSRLSSQAIDELVPAVVALSQTLSGRKIARRLRISRGTVAGILSGQRRPRSRSEPAPEAPKELARCPGCGHLVYLPCLLCTTRKLMAKGRRPFGAKEPIESLGFDLKPDDHARYLEVRAPGAVA